MVLGVHCLSNVLLAVVCLCLSEQLGHHICPGLGLPHSRCTSCWNRVETGRKCLPFQRDVFVFLIILTTLESMSELYMLLGS